jgi:hypothetical protein
VLAPGTARIFSLFDEPKIEAPDGVWLVTTGLLYITPQKQVRWKGNSISNLIFYDKIKFSI